MKAVLQVLRSHFGVYYSFGGHLPDIPERTRLNSFSACHHHTQDLHSDNFCQPQATFLHIRNKKCRQMRDASRDQSRSHHRHTGLMSWAKSTIILPGCCVPPKMIALNPGSASSNGPWRNSAACKPSNAHLAASFEINAPFQTAAIELPRPRKIRFFTLPSKRSILSSWASQSCKYW